VFDFFRESNVCVFCDGSANDEHNTGRAMR
jgi:hypothetical protein